MKALSIMRMDFMKMISLWYFLIVIFSTLTINYFGVDGAHYHHNKRQQPNLMPTLTVDVGPQSTNLPTPIHQDKPVDYFFPVDAQLFNFSCVIKHPSLRYKVIITREQTPNTGIKTEPVDMLDPSDYILHRNLVKEQERMFIEYDEYHGASEPTVKYLRVSLIIKGLKTKDSGIYKCKYYSLVKQINVVVFKQAHQKDVTFPSPKIDKVQLNQPITVNCKIQDVYPKPIVSFMQSNGVSFNPESITVKDVSTKTDDFYLYSLNYALNFTPKYKDNNQNLTCSVVSYGASNLTVQKSNLLKVEGIEIITEECKEVHTVNLNDQDVKITCLFFSNPRVEPEWETKVTKLPLNPESTSTAQNDLNVEGTPENNQNEDTIKISTQDDDSSNYVSSVEETEPNSGVYRAILKIKIVGEQDLKNYTLRLDNNRKKIEHVITLKTEGNQKDLSLGSNQNNSATLNRFHSIFLIYFSVKFSKLFRDLIR